MFYSLSDLFWLFLPTLAVGYLWTGMAAKEQVRRVAARYCREQGLQLLDDTVALTRTRLKRDERGQLRLHRSYGFEFTSTGEYRYAGTVVLHGRRITRIQLSPYHVP
ncbi:DUF3301 domain-containing protein [Microbulbifer thermotolerans]|uniref:DUF3301 domain-containing protein n=1 Tax=Microbulbifer thermotolerans TaxID=252514 RepID=UPI00224AADF5|nr:DUF3301 domain-containing protein [Microbulbifer thermotolerans]MCX2784332.1 DUF3301 domain-containing protein [Microbulbifer thermotolerans]WKT61743.1 DUF3301 domain-containing protein [Microbulbifer thermotolerans]